MVSGVVLDDQSGEALPGANVLVEGTSLGAASDVDGVFRIALPDSLRGARLVLRATFVGFEPASVVVPVDRRAPLRIRLRPAFTDAGLLVVTGTRTARELETIAIPTDVVDAQQIAEQGATRLSDLLAEQPGLAPVFSLGSGIQVQGFDPEYTLILIDGEPVIGRTRGTLDLERLGVSGVERVEIVKGPSSSLYGSEALAGVVNIITRRPEGVSAALQTRLETNATRDFTLEGEAGRGDIGARLTLNRYESGGYDAVPGDNFGPTVPSFTDHSAAFRLRAGSAFGLSARFAEQRQRYDADLLLGETWVPHTMREARTDWSLAPSVTLRPSQRLTLTTRAYLADYATRLTSDAVASATGPGARTTDSRFAQRLAKLDVQADLIVGAKHLASVGAGGQRETVEADRIGGGKREADAAFVFAQHEWMPSRRLSLVTSARYDAPGDYQHTLSPKIAVQVQPATLFGEPLRARASVGSGFKAPTFQQLYLDFTNPAAGYTVVGAVDADAVLQRLEDEGLIAPGSIGAGLGLLEPERSWAAHASADVPLGDRLGGALRLKLGAFYHRVRNLIEFAPVANKLNGQQVFSYENIARVQMRGLETEATWDFGSPLRLDASYQYLRAEDLDVLAAIDAGSVFARDEQGRDYRITRDDYGGLFDRSRHSGTLRLTTTLRTTTLAARAVWRGRYGFRSGDTNRDANGSTLLDDDREYVRGHVLWNATLTQPLPRGLTLQVGAKNLFGYRDLAHIPGLPGRLLFASVRLDV